MILKPVRTFFPSRLAFVLAAAAFGTLGATAAHAQVTSPGPDQNPGGAVPQAATQQGVPAGTPVGAQAPAAGDNIPTATISNQPPSAFHRGKKKADPAVKDTKTVQSKDTKKNVKKNTKADALIGVDSKLPDKQLYDKAYAAIQKGHYDVARLDLQTMLNTYPDSQYQMRAKLAIADSWYKEGGTAALTQAESEYADFRVFFPNAPEAAEAQMRIGDIYFRQMDRPDRDHAKSIHAEEEYRRMLTDYPDSTLVPQAKQRLRDVQEVLATRDADIAAFYATRENWAAVIARYQTVVDTYPLYSHMDDALIGLGDAYEAQARYIRTLKLAEGPKQKLEKTYDDQAIAAYSKVVLEHSAAPHVEDARDRLAAMNVPIPEPTKDQLAASAAMENSRNSYRLADRARLLIMHAPDTVTSARMGEPTMADPHATTAPEVTKSVVANFNAALNPNAAKPADATATAAAQPDAAAPATAAVPAKPLAFQDVTTGDAPANSGAVEMTPASSGTTSTGTSMGVEILNSSSPTGTAADPNNGLHAVRPADSTPLPPVESAAPTPGQVNEATNPQPAAQAAPADGKKPKAAYDKGDESSSKHKKKKGIAKINPF
ncbi:outer membrane protein assembly factor BamD [Granulicella tundricola]|uniref:Outer membrane assembly lipoprotein YfiO n=1 Tax=Granulicella tundricola (strain ATCC BAA-1859 / DSM 23138 / MP5ACTX9) TaxID=1198114 RepID=E8X2S7_GRATM|nr:outer membrane protein assembly factor BamD [Granulicella tundricola]ADW70374.1 outer membrane assembly lipoprotein YfiO [Granulicella tundricola MP5ACTX9]